MVFYLKYRPQKIADLDSKELRERLYSVFSGSSIPHAFLFTGPKGLGKTSTARIVAKTVNCENSSKLKTQNSKQQLKVQRLKNTEPCNQCSQCISITNGSNLDVLEIDGASNRGIDEIRDLREKIKLSPVSAKKKVYIIDEVHMLTTEAFNALLKTLEEPPNHAMFIFCTTELHKVPKTITSRCFHIPFSVASEEELISSFQRILEGEKLDVEKDVFAEIAKLSDGSFRDGAKILEELVLLSSGEKITKEILEEKYKIISIVQHVTNLVIFLIEKDAKAALGLISKLVSEGVDLKYFIEQLLEAFHKILLAQLGIESASLKYPKGVSIEEIKSLTELISKAHSELKYSVIPQLPLEFAIIEWGLKTNKEEKFSVVPRNVPSSSALSVANTDDKQIWTKLIDEVKMKNHSLAGVLRGCSLKSFSDGKLEIETSFKFHKEKLSEEKSLNILEQAAFEIAGKNVQVLVELKGVI